MRDQTHEARELFLAHSPYMQVGDSRAILPDVELLEHLADLLDDWVVHLSV